MKRLVLFHSSLVAGGAERVLSMMASYWCARGHEITLLTTAGTDHDFYPIDPRVNRVGLGLLKPSSGLGDAVASNARRVARLRAAFVHARPDAVISFSDRNNVLSVLAAARTGIPVILSERNDPAHLPLGAPWRLLRRVTYPRAAAVVVQTERVAAWARGVVPRAKVSVIPNPVSKPAVVARGSAAGFKTVLAVGRLEQQKGFDLLIEAFASCAAAHREWRLVIAGDGSRRTALEDQIADRALQERISLPGTVANISSLFRAAELFVLSSRFEGFPNVLLEAMAHGVPVVAFDCPSGPSEIVRSGLDGLLVPPADGAALASAMSKMMSDAGLRASLATAAVDVTERFGIEPVMARWDDVIEQVVGRALHRSK